MAEHESTLVQPGDLMIRLLEVEAALEKEIAARNAAIDNLQAQINDIIEQLAELDPGGGGDPGDPADVDRLYRSILLGSQTDGSTAIRNPNVFDGTGASFYRAVYGLNAENRTRILSSFSTSPTAYKALLQTLYDPTDNRFFTSSSVSVSTTIFGSSGSSASNDYLLGLRDMSGSPSIMKVIFGSPNDLRSLHELVGGSEASKSILGRIFGTGGITTLNGYGIGRPLIEQIFGSYSFGNHIGFNLAGKIWANTAQVKTQPIQAQINQTNSDMAVLESRIIALEMSA